MEQAIACVALVRFRKLAIEIVLVVCGGLVPLKRGWAVGSSEPYEFTAGLFCRCKLAAVFVGSLYLYSWSTLHSQSEHIGIADLQYKSRRSHLFGVTLSRHLTVGF